MFWLLPAAASTYTVVQLRRYDDTRVVPELFGIDGAVYIRSLGAADQARLRGPDGEFVAVEAHTMDGAVRLRPLQPVSPGAYQLELLTYYNADGTMTRLVSQQGTPIGAQFAIWVPVPLIVTEGSSEVPPPPGPVRWQDQQGWLRGKLATPSDSWTEWEVEGMGPVGLVRGEWGAQNFAWGIPAGARGRAVNVGPEGRRAPGPWSAIPELEPAGVHGIHGTPGWKTVAHSPRSGGVARVPTCTLTPGEVLSRVDHPDGVLLRDGSGVLHAISVEPFSAVTVDGVRHEGFPMFDPPAAALVGSGEGLTVFGKQPSIGIHLATGHKRTWKGTEPVPVERLRFRGGTAVAKRAWRVTVNGVESQHPRLRGTLVERDGELELHELAKGTWTVRSVGCGPPTGPPESVPPSLLRRYDVGVLE